MTSFQSGRRPRYSAEGFLSASEGDALSTNWTSSTSSESSEMPELFSAATMGKIRTKCHHRCVVCSKLVSTSGRCAHIVDSAERGARNATFAIKAGGLDPTFSRSTVQNGILLCKQCDKDYLSPDILILSPPQQVLQFLVDYVETNNTIPIYQILEKLRTRSAMPYVNGPDPTPALPYLDLFSLVTLDSEKAEGMQLILAEAKVSQLLDGQWSVVPVTGASSPTTAQIHDATALPSSFITSTPVLLSSTNTRPPLHWRLPAGITPILARLLDRVAKPPPFSKSEEIRLAILLRSLLMRRYAETKGPSGGPGYGGGHLRGPGGGGKSKGGRKRKDATPLSPVTSTVLSVQGQTLHSHVHQNIAPQTTQTRTLFTSVSRRFISRSYPHFHQTQRIRVTPIMQTLRSLQHRLLRFA